MAIERNVNISIELCAGDDRPVKVRISKNETKRRQMGKKDLRCKTLEVHRECLAGQIMINHKMQLKSRDSL